ncbi:hypothetical protein LIA77_01990 [Sarocladium implicatum]|nr:hypothetical protein LIA77_01990 [Sarocladium implicatum]
MHCRVLPYLSALGFSSSSVHPASVITTVTVQGFKSSSLTRAFLPLCLDVTAFLSLRFCCQSLSILPFVPFGASEAPLISSSSHCFTASLPPQSDIYNRSTKGFSAHLKSLTIFCRRRHTFELSYLTAQTTATVYSDPDHDCTRVGSRNPAFCEPRASAVHPSKLYCGQLLFATLGR